MLYTEAWIQHNDDIFAKAGCALRIGITNIKKRLESQAEAEYFLFFEPYLRVIFSAMRQCNETA